MRKSDKTHEIAVFNPELKDAPGWISLSSEKRDELWQIATENQEFRRMKGLGEFGELMTLYRASRVLEGEELRLRDYIARLYPDRHQRTVLRKQKAFEELAATIPPRWLERLSAIGKDVLPQFERLAKAPIGDIRNAFRDMPKLLPASTEEDFEKYLEAVDEKIAEERKDRTRPRLKTRDAMEKAAFNAILAYMRKAGLKTSAEKRQFLQRIVGWAMNEEAVHGTLRAGRIPAPDGLVVKRGRPRNKKPPEAARGG